MTLNALDNIDHDNDHWCGGKGSAEDVSQTGLYVLGNAVTEEVESQKNEGNADNGESQWAARCYETKQQDLLPPCGNSVCHIALQSAD